MKGAQIKIASMNVHSLQIRKFKRLARKLNRSNNPAAVISLQETWTNNNSRVIQDIESSGYRVLHKPRYNQQFGRGGGVAIVRLGPRLKFGPIRLRYRPRTLEYVVGRVQTRSHICRIINVYRPGSKQATNMFFFLSWKNL